MVRMQTRADDAALTGGGDATGDVVSAPAARESRAASRLRRDLPLALASLPMLVFLLLPLVALVLRVAPGDLLGNLTNPEVAQAVQLSLATTLATLAITLLAGTPLAYLLARRAFRGRAALETLLDLPIVLPPAVAGIALLLAFGRFGLLGSTFRAAGIQIAFTPVAVVLAQTFVAAPYYIRTARVAFAGVDCELEQAAALDGATPLRVFRHITLPLTAAQLFGGAVLTWARALGEFGATILFAGNFAGRTQTMPLAIYLDFESDLQVAITLGIILLALSFVVLFAVRTALRQRIEVLS